MRALRRYRMYYPWVFLAVLILYFSLNEGLFYTPSNFINIARSVSVTGLYALGQTFVFISGGIDLSVINIGAGTAMVFGRLFEDGMSSQGALTIAFFYAAGLGLINGLLVTKGRIPPFVATLASSYAFSGLTAWIGHGGSIHQLSLQADPPDEFFGTLGNAAVGVVPVRIIIALGTALGSIILLHFTIFGRHLYAAGANPRAARFSGVNVDRVRIAAYVICGLFCGMAALIRVSDLSSAERTGVTLLTQGPTLLDSIGAVLIGGASFSGGFGTIQGTIAGTLIVGVLRNGLLWGGVPWWAHFPLSSGGVIIGAVAIGALLSGNLTFAMPALPQRLTNLLERFRVPWPRQA